MENHEITVINGTDTYTGLYTGTLEDNKPTGQAKYVVKIDDTSNWVYSGNFEEGQFSGEGTVENYPCTVKLGIQNDDGVYSGTFNNGVINGTGAFDSSLGWTYVGNFENGAIKGEGTIKEFPYQLSYENKTLDGIYEGAVLDAEPSGEGSIRIEDDGIELTYEGNWNEGSFSGDGTLKSNSYSVSFSDGIVRTGEYEGTTLDGKASGEGVFTATNLAGEKYTYTGEFSEGSFEGIGTIDFENENITDYSGHFTKGECTPTKSELIAYIGSIKDFVAYSVSEKSLKFIDSYENLFMADNVEAVEPLVNKDITLNELYKTPQEHPDEIFAVKTKKITQIRQEDVYDKTVTWFITEDANSNRMFVVCNRELPDINKNDKVTVYGLPIGIGSYKNAFNGSVSAFVIYACFVTK